MAKPKQKTVPTRFTVVIVDEQYDFCEKGALAVNGGNKAVTQTCRFLRKNAALIDRVVLTADWHPSNHCSFVAQGGPWPPHCVQHSRGAAIHDRLMQTILKLGIPYEVVTKGSNPKMEEYGAFSVVPKRFADKELWVMGIAGDYCVMETTINLLKAKPRRLVLYGPGIASIDEAQFCKLLDEHTREYANLEIR
ncbi:MAG: isochorismatase family protein [Alloprevotella sp.]|nr:isochorismatase family protein [Alloprevotella sp.]